MRHMICFCFMLSLCRLDAQTFVEIPNSNPFGRGAGLGTIGLADLDGDADQDLILTGLREQGTLVYLNNGDGEFVEDNRSELAIVYDGTVSFIDIDGDTDLDLLLTGADETDAYVARLYRNDGSGRFSEDTRSSIVGVVAGSIASADIDGDGDQDLVIIGNDDGGGTRRRTRIYSNNGNGRFTGGTSNLIQGVLGSVAFSDIDGDSDPDLLIAGRTIFSTLVIKLYRNNGTGQFTEDTNSGLEGFAGLKVDIADVDGDADPDILTMGYDETALFRNDGTGTFTRDIGNSFDVSSGSVTFTDVDGDADMDIFLTGSTNNGVQVAQLYKNDGLGSFTEDPGLSLADISPSSVAPLDIDRDSDTDIFLIRNRGFTLYVNDGGGTFTQKISSGLEAVVGGITSIDVDADDDLDLFLTGIGADGTWTTNLYLNDGFGEFTRDLGNRFINVAGSPGSAAFADVDNDSDPDLLITGGSSDGIKSVLYHNDGVGRFTERSNDEIVNVELGAVAFADIDGDDDPDLFITGLADSGLTARLYRNDGSGGFSEDSGSSFDAVFGGTVTFADVDEDTDQDLFITGYISGIEVVSKLYRNDGAGGFTEDVVNSFEGVYGRSVNFVDMDRDGALDIVISGSLIGFPSLGIKLYRNDGTGRFTVDSISDLSDIDVRAMNFADMDGDADPDFLLTGQNGEGVIITYLYRNDGAGNFARDSEMSLPGLGSGSINLFDIDRDNDLDLMIAGRDGFGAPLLKLYRNLPILDTEPDGENIPLIFVPNPADQGSTTLYVQLGEEETSSGHLTVYDLRGRAVHRERLFLRSGVNQFDLSLPSLTAGLYLTKLTIETQVATGKLIVR